MGFESRPAHKEGRPRELELKLELEPGGDRLLMQHPLLSDRLGEERQTISTYFDTASGALRDAGLTLRVRQTGAAFVQTVKSNPRRSAGLFDRWEWEEPIAGPEPDIRRVPSIPARLGDRLARKGLQPVFAARVGRRTAMIESGQARVEVVIDRGAVVAGDKCEDLLEVELELVDGSPRDLFEMARTLQAQVPLRIGILSKAERGQRLANGKGGTATKAEPVRLSPEMTATDSFRTIAFACIHHFRANELLVSAVRDPDALHQCRVALRRLRSAMSLFRPILPDGPRVRFKEEVRILAGELGDARNLDVLLRRRGDDLDSRSRDALLARRTAAYDRAVEALRSPSMQRMMIDLAEWVALGGEGGDAATADRLIGPFSAEVLDRYWRKVKRRGSKLAAIDDDARHELRIAGKKLRYAGEFFASLYPGRPGRDAFLGEMEKLQDRLGDLNDLATERALEAELAACGIVLPPLRHKAGDSAFRKKALAAAERTFGRLAEIRPYWRDS